MTYVVTEPCKNCKDTACVEVCPVESFRDAGQMLVIDPDTCVDCDACVSECPVDAIFFEVDVPVQWKHYIGINEERAAVSPVIAERREQK
ncbi:MAG: 4Fe-4S dicluster domain-containing protein [Fuerstiella sp.]